jgi:hypothetical protein
LKGDGIVPEWVIEMAAAAALAVMAWFLRGLREDLDKNNRDRRNEIEGIRLDLAKNYVTHRQLRGLRNDLRQALQMMNYLQLELARHFKFKPFVPRPDPNSEYDQEQESEHNDE